MSDELSLVCRLPHGAARFAGNGRQLREDAKVDFHPDLAPERCQSLTVPSPLTAAQHRGESHGAKVGPAATPVQLYNVALSLSSIQQNTLETQPPPLRAAALLVSISRPIRGCPKPPIKIPTRGSSQKWPSKLAGSGEPWPQTVCFVGQQSRDELPEFHQGSSGLRLI